MAKAALNIMTRTCVEDYARARIYMNAVAPGWVSLQQPDAQAERLRARGVEPPCDVHDAAARICDPIYLALAEDTVHFGKFWKDYQEISW